MVGVEKKFVTETEAELVILKVIVVNKINRVDGFDESDEIDESDWFDKHRRLLCHDVIH